MVKEKILCAVVNYNNIIVSGFRHKNCYETIEKLLQISTPNDIDRNNEGFLTSSNRFVNRNEAFIITKLNNQIWHNLFDNDTDENSFLTSEDLY